QGEMAAGIRVEKNKSVSIIRRRGLDQRENGVPDQCDLGSPPRRAFVCQRAQTLRTLGFAEVVPEAWSESARRTVDDMGALALNRIQRKKNAEFAQRVAHAPG